MPTGHYRRGLEDLGAGNYAWLQPDGSWGYSNAGLVTDGGQALLVDTLFDLNLTRQMLDAMADATPSARNIETVVNTHANGDHCFGNELVGASTIIASRASAEEMSEVTAADLAAIMKQKDALGEAAGYLERIFGAFEFEGITPTPPTQTFEGEYTYWVGDKRVQMVEVGPAHTRGDILIHVPEDDILFTGDILFIDGTPILWAGPVDNWIRACDLIAEMQPAVIVPGHGPLTDLAGVRGVRDYLTYIRDEARQRFDAGLSAPDAARDIALGGYSSWLDSERIVVNVHTLYREFDPTQEPPGTTELFTLMAELAQ